MENDNKILITHGIEDDVLAPLRGLAKVEKWNNVPYNVMPREEVMNEIEDAIGIINQGELQVDDYLLKKAKKLKIVANASIGYDNLNLELMKEYGIWGSNAPGFFDYPVAEYVIGALISVSRNMIGANQFVRSGNWKKFEPGRWDGFSPKGKTLGIVGMGKIGQKVAELGSSLGMDIIYYNRSQRSGFNPLFQPAKFNDLLLQSDFITVHVPLNANTKHLFTSKEFSLMKQEVIFINTSRGKVVKENDLIKALKEKKIRGAVLDVFEDEPYVPQELINMENLLITPHMAGGSKYARKASHQQAVNNVVEVLHNREPINSLMAL